ncbi:histidine phosphatase family protein [Pseudomonas sp. MRSN 12121]|uniref:lipopolysaccharide core heptose(II)-phosphate phosphatase PmrG n=1 Tax=Pseudomonas sp. MRSN 12121 TaxID=1611770 RepID=UPI000A632C19|nr:histidine phosphatase family protein [Pseudomonas sp. MRSN 12121]
MVARIAIKGLFPRLVLLALAGALLAGFMLWPRSPLDLASAADLRASGLVEQWRAGNVVVLVRHVERCDRSPHPCLGPADGITRLGSEAAIHLGVAFRTLGMERTDVLSSPLTRTAQTSAAMFDHPAISQEWLASCGKPLRDDVVAHKSPHHNLLLVTHSGCISDFESQTGFKHAHASEYGSALFVSVMAGQVKVLGVVNEQNWSLLLNSTL